MDKNFRDHLADLLDEYREAKGRAMDAERQLNATAREFAKKTIRDVDDFNPARLHRVGIELVHALKR